MRYTPANIIQSWKLWYHAGKLNYRYPDLDPSRYPHLGASRPTHFIGKMALWVGYKLAEMNSLHGG